MFSGLTNQVTSWMGAVKGEPQDEEVPAPPNAEAAVPVAAAAPPSEPGVEDGATADQQIPLDDENAQKTGMFSNVKGWLGNASIPSMPTMAMPSMPAMPAMPTMPGMPAMPSIPGLRKGAEEGAEGLGEAGADATGGISGDDEDKSRYISATEGADSHPASGGGTPTDEGQIGQVTTKVTQGAKHFGSFLSSAINKAGARIKETVKDNTILDSFNKEQEAFIQGQAGSGQSGATPWAGHSNEAKIKEEILGLSQDRRNFVRAPPAGVDFEFNYDTAYPTAIAIMAEDSALEKMRFELVPKIITEENFWKNYFYRVSLIIQAAELGTLGADGVGAASSEDDKNKNSETNSSKSENASDGARNKPQVEASNEQNSNMINAKKLSESEFVSDTFQTTDTDLEEVKDGMRKLGIETQRPLDNNEEQWEKDLEAELQEFEMVNDGASGGGGGGESSLTITNIRNRSPSNNDWEQYADLIDETDDLK